MSELAIAQHSRVQQRRIADLDRKQSSIIEWPMGAAATPLAILDYYDLTSTTVKIRGDGDANKVLCLGGTWTAVGAGAGSVDFDTALTLSDNTFIVIQLERETAELTLEAKSGITEPPDGDDDSEYYALWYFPWDSENDVIDAAGIRDWRYARHMTAMED